jgi:hypothetical protein
MSNFVNQPLALLEALPAPEQRRAASRLQGVAALEDDSLVHEAPAIVGRRTASALAHAAAA